ncbi:MAG TPA: hypothetical protein VNH20_07065 [Candidatus Dormibacteraeota bacterium]|nr:hypothetical protein [Candidatus Dormibacteraeota bacterium]
MPARQVAATSLLAAGTAAVLDQVGREIQLSTTWSGTPVGQTGACGRPRAGCRR